MGDGTGTTIKKDGLQGAATLTDTFLQNVGVPRAEGIVMRRCRILAKDIRGKPWSSTSKEARGSRPRKHHSDSFTSHGNFFRHVPSTNKANPCPRWRPTNQLSSLSAAFYMFSSIPTSNCCLSFSTQCLTC